MVIEVGQRRAHQQRPRGSAVLVCSKGLGGVCWLLVSALGETEREREILELIMGLIAGREQKKGELERVKGEAWVWY